MRSAGSGDGTRFLAMLPHETLGKFTVLINGRLLDVRFK